MIQSSGSNASTLPWGDTDGNSKVNVLDITRAVDALKGIAGPTATLERVNLWPCDTDERLDVLDISSAVDSVKGLPFSCAPVCP